ncbi:MAG: hypothetical protein JWQ94_1632 [Tardiphaga sp.]|nr:hypothetical protein [Tardiphaga sp.]
MAATPLVDLDVAMGRELLDILDRAHFPVTGAAWIYFEDRDEWKLVLRTPKAEKDRLDALLQIAQALDAEGDLRSRIDFTRLKIVPPKDNVMAAMGRTVKTDGSAPVRFDRNLVDGTMINDALIYRLAA